MAKDLELQFFWNRNRHSPTSVCQSMRKQSLSYVNVAYGRRCNNLFRKPHRRSHYNSFIFLISIGKGSQIWKCRRRWKVRNTLRAPHVQCAPAVRLKLTSGHFNWQKVNSALAEPDLTHNKVTLNQFDVSQLHILLDPKIVRRLKIRLQIRSPLHMDLTTGMHCIVFSPGLCSSSADFFLHFIFFHPTDQLPVTWSQMWPVTSDPPTRPSSLPYHRSLKPVPYLAPAALSTWLLKWSWLNSALLSSWISTEKFWKHKNKTCWNFCNLHFSSYCINYQK